MDATYAERTFAVHDERVVPIWCKAAVPCVIVLTVTGFIAARPSADVFANIELLPVNIESTQSCNTICQETQTDCTLRCDQDAPCIQRCRAAAEDCVKRCASQATDGGAPVLPDAGTHDR